MAETLAVTDVGREREYNEDAVYAGSVGDRTLLAVADGMGGHSAGDIASQEALETFVEYLEERGPPGEYESVEETLKAGASEANRHLQEMAAKNANLEGMGTTLVAALVDGETATLVNVGDSRAYHATLSGIEQVTTDQSLVQKLVEEGTIEPEEATDHPQKNVLSQALGTETEVDPDTYHLTIEGTLLLCSDGLCDEVDDEKIQQLVTGSDSLEEASQRLVDRANEVDGSDNVSVVLGR